MQLQQLTEEEGKIRDMLSSASSAGVGGGGGGALWELQGKKQAERRHLMRRQLTQLKEVLSTRTQRDFEESALKTAFISIYKARTDSLLFSPSFSLFSLCVCERAEMEGGADNSCGNDEGAGTAQPQPRRCRCHLSSSPSSSSCCLFFFLFLSSICGWSFFLFLFFLISISPILWARRTEEERGATIRSAPFFFFGCLANSFYSIFSLCCIALRCVVLRAARVPGNSGSSSAYVGYPLEVKLVEVPCNDTEELAARANEITAEARAALFYSLLFCSRAM